jgi:hypothetical protein
MLLLPRDFPADITLKRQSPVRTVIRTYNMDLSGIIPFTLAKFNARYVTPRLMSTVTVAM